MKLNYKHTLIASFAGYVTQAIVNNFAPLLFLTFHRQFDIDLAKITLLVTVNFLVQLTVDFISPAFINKIGYRKSIVIAHLCSALGLVAMGISPNFLPSYPALLFSAVIYAIGGGIIEVLISPIAEACPTKNKASVMSLLHSFYCWGTAFVVLFSTVFMHLSGGEWSLLALLWALFPLLNGIFFCFVPIYQLPEENSSKASSKMFLTSKFILFVILMLCAGASEMAMSQWASFFVEDALGVPKAIGDIMGICLFAILMGTARTVFAAVGHKTGIRKALISSAVLCVMCYITVALSPLPALSLIGCALCGLSVGVLWPGVFSMASEHFPKGGTKLFALLALAGDGGCSSGPTLAGFVSSLTGDNLKMGLLVAAIFPLILILAATALKKGVKN